MNYFTPLYQLIYDFDEMVKRNALKCLSTFTESFPGVFLSNNLVINKIEHLIYLTASSDKIVQTLTLDILINITDHLKNIQAC
jgi:hypothetical protein